MFYKEGLSPAHVQMERRKEERGKLSNRKIRQFMEQRYRRPKSTNQDRRMLLPLRWGNKNKWRVMRALLSVAQLTQESQG